MSNILETEILHKIPISCANFLDFPRKILILNISQINFIIFILQKNQFNNNIVAYITSSKINNKNWYSAAIKNSINFFLNSQHHKYEKDSYIKMDFILILAFKDMIARKFLICFALCCESCQIIQWIFISFINTIF